MENLNTEPVIVAENGTIHWKADAMSPDTIARVINERGKTIEWLKEKMELAARKERRRWGQQFTNTQMEALARILREKYAGHFGGSPESYDLASSEAKQTRQCRGLLPKWERNMLIIAIDPGASGGMAASHDGSAPLVFKMPDTPRDIYDLLWSVQHTGCCIPEKMACRAVMEKVGMHRQGNNASASCKFARHCGHIEMALLALGMPFEEPTPQKWMKTLGAMPKDKKDRKNHIKDLMQRRYPGIKVTLWNADALGILTWALEQDK